MLEAVAPVEVSPERTKEATTPTFWRTRLDSKSGRIFYYNSQTRAVAWVLPPGAQLIPQDKSPTREPRMSLINRRSQSLSTLAEDGLACGLCNADVSGLTNCSKCGALVLVPEEKVSSVPAGSVKPNLRLSLEDGKPILHRLSSDKNSGDEDPMSPRLAPVSPPAKAAPTRGGYTPKSRVNPLSDRMKAARSSESDALSPKSSEPPTPTSRVPSKPAPKREKSSILQASATESLDSPVHDEKKREIEKKVREPAADFRAGFRELTARSRESRQRSAPNVSINTDLPQSREERQRSAPHIEVSETHSASASRSPTASSQHADLSTLDELDLPPPPDDNEEPPPPEEEPPPPDCFLEPSPEPEQDDRTHSQNASQEDNSSVRKPSRRKLVRALDDVEDMVVGSEASDENLSLRNKSEKELAAFIESLRPQYGEGQLARDPELLKNFFVQLINIPESNRHLVFHEFFLSIFWHDSVMQELLKYGSWKQWLLILISEAQTTSDAILDYVLMTLIGMTSYFFRHYSESTNAVCKIDSEEPLPLGFGTEMRSMRDFLIDATTEIDKHSQGISLRVLAGTAMKIVAWDRRPPWTAPDFAAPQWQNLFSMLEAQEEYLFFPLPERQFALPVGPDFAGLAVIESTIAMLEKLKVHQLDAVPETVPELVRLQKLYSTKGVQELDFFKKLRDFFAFYGQMDCMEIQKADFTIRTKVPVNCSISEFCHLLQSRKRIEYQKVQKTVTEYLKSVREHYKKVFSGEIAFSPRVDNRIKKTTMRKESKEDNSRGGSISGMIEASSPRKSHNRVDSSFMGLSRLAKHDRQSSGRVGLSFP